MVRPVDEFCGIPICFNEEYAGLARSVGLWPRKRIIIGTRFMVLKHEERIAVLLHETHHCRAFHLEKRILLIPFLWTKWIEKVCRQHELDADSYASNNGFGAEMLSVIHKFFRNPIDEFYPTYEQRAENLLRLMHGGVNEAAA